MHPADIKASLEKKGYRAAFVARDLSVNKSTVTRVIRGEICNERVAARISEVTGIPVSKLWPGRYSAPARLRAA